MSVRFHLRRRLALALASSTFVVSTSFGLTSFAQETGRANQQSQQQESSQRTSEGRADSTPPERQTAKAPDERADDEAPQLGVLTGSCPGKAVCVIGTIPYSPAAEAGIEPGDYILSVDGNEVTSPAALKKFIAKQSPDAEVTLKVWRKGEERECKVQLASQADELPKSHDAWLGVMLASEEKNGLRIEHIVPGSPAADSELEEGDTLLKIREAEVTDSETFVEKIEAMGPGDELKLTISRDGKEREVAVTLGSFADAPIGFLRQLQSNFEQSAHRGGQADMSSTELLDRAVDDLRHQVRELRKEVRELKGDKPASREKAAKDKKEDVSMLAIPTVVGLVSQIQLRIPSPNIQRRSYYGGYNSYNNYGNNFNRYGNGYSNYYGNGYRTPYGNNSYYYRNGGRPYYYGGNDSWYGNRPRPGIQLGPNLGIYW